MSIDDFEKYISSDNPVIIHYKTSSMNNPFSVVDYLKEAPGIYAWYNGYSKDSIEKLIYSEIKRENFVERSGNIENFYKVTIKNKTPDTRVFKEGIRELLKYKDFNNLFKTLLKNNIYFQSPMYIGKSNKIKNRIKDHYDMKTDFSKRVVELDLNMRDLDLIVCYLGDYEYNETEIRNIEKILSVFFNPSFSVKFG